MPPQVPSAPTPPTIWKMMFSPFAAEKYHAELYAYRIMTGAVTDADRLLGRRIGAALGVVFVLFCVYLAIDVIIDLREIREEGRQGQAEFRRSIEKANQEAARGFSAP